jgi:hypothetical protein
MVAHCSEPNSIAKELYAGRMRKDSSPILRGPGRLYEVAFPFNLYAIRNVAGVLRKMSELGKH